MRRRGFLAIGGVGSLGWPLCSRAQQADRTWRLAILTQAEPVDRATGKRERHWTTFFDELRRLGYEEGRNLAIAWYSSQLDDMRAADLAQGVAGQKPDAIFTPDVRMAVLLKTVAAQIPVVAITVDPVGSGVAASMARPGGNVTGFTTDPGPEMTGKRLEIFRQAVPTASRIALLMPRRTMDSPGNKMARESVRRAGMTMVEAVLEAPIDAAGVRRAFDDMTRHSVDAVWVATSGETREHRQLIAELATSAKLPSLFGWRENVEAGGLLSYGNDAADMYRHAAGYVDRILRGARPGEMPIQQPSRFELVVNLRTARALGLTIPPAILLRADEVIE